MDFAIPPEITAYLAELDAFIEGEIVPLEREHPLGILLVGVGLGRLQHLLGVGRKR